MSLDEQDVSVSIYSPKGEQMFQEGFEAGYSQAAYDYLSNEVPNLEDFDSCRNLRQAYELGFELGYLRKLAEILVLQEKVYG